MKKSSRLLACLLLPLCAAPVFAQSPIIYAIVGRTLSDPGLKPVIDKMEEAEKIYSAARLSERYVAIMTRGPYGGGESSTQSVARVSNIYPKNWFLRFNAHITPVPYLKDEWKRGAPAGNCWRVMTVVTFSPALPEERGSGPVAAKTSAISGFACPDGTFTDVPPPDNSYFEDLEL